MIARLDEPAAAAVEAAGGKGSSLARMAALGLPVPGGFVVLADALAVTLATAGTDARLRECLAAVDDAERRQASETASALVQAAPLAPGLEAAIAEAVDALGDGTSLAVRSSAVAEDSEAASYAGQQDTYLHVRGADRVVQRVRDCWASFFGEHAIFYRQRKGSLDDLRMAVVVQRMVEPDVAGVLFTIDPIRQRRDQMVVEAALGLGEAVVQGVVTPDHYVLARDGRIKQSVVATQPYAIVRGPDGGTEHRPLTPEEGGRQKLTADDLRRLADLGRQLEEHLGGPQDVEWAIAGGELHLLQSRPVTT
jgi:pyruvate, water dikinase